MARHKIVLSVCLLKSRVSVAVVCSTSISTVPYSQLQANTQQQCELMEAQPQEDGWPLGLRPLNARVGLGRNRDFNGSISFSTLLTASNSSSADFSSDLDTESTGSFFHDRSITLGSLIGVSSILELSRRSTRGRTAETVRDCKNYKSKPWFCSICSRLSTDAVNTNKNAPSLGHFLESERRAASNIHRRNMIYGPSDFCPILPNHGLNSLFLGDEIAPRSSVSLGLDGGNGYAAPLIFSCFCGQLIE
ncbi:unnamed protein product [Dovyalis caffra]|uniref:Uncharacterized protein n=1 Tax=Dovyalis caffra TaxID=77055 RepID=A0AAV1REQ1_9ROSI|nr:unnamed protein product [Dovyalis caffra]